MGPWILTADSVEFPPKLAIQSRVNGELRQDSNTELLIHGIEEVICELSSGMTLKSGTIIATGTPSGVGMGFDPPKFLCPATWWNVRSRHWHVKEYRCGIESVRKVAMKGTETGEKRRMFSSWFYLRETWKEIAKKIKKGTNLGGNHDGDERRKPEIKTEIKNRAEKKENEMEEIRTMLEKVAAER